MTTACQAIVFYHSCGCKSNNNPVCFCFRPECQHEALSLVIGRLPFACGSQQGPSEACQVEDETKKRFVREVDTADRLTSLTVLPGCTMNDITALVSPRPELLTPDGEFYNRYQQRYGVDANEYPVPEPSSSPYTDGNEVDFQDNVVRDSSGITDRDNKVGSNLQHVQIEDRDIHDNITENDKSEDSTKNGDAKAGLFILGGEDSDNEFMDIELDDDYDDIYEDVDMNEKFECYGEHKGETNIGGDLGEVDPHDAEVSRKIDRLEEEKRDSMDILSCVGKVEGTRGAPSPVQDRFGGTAMSDDVLDILVTDPKAPEKQQTTFGMVWAYIKGR
ncbi:hypothetical protein F5B19DRAFT_101586 [Rostrohypoxylon terebratum]|nr:hypothetical protein F5B19DRAFT_101586 [Rostrohypoxylon terebratum]